MAVSSSSIRRGSHRARSTTTTWRRFRRRAATGRRTTSPRSGSAWRTAFPTYMLASGLMASGMTWSQALFTILLGNTIVLVPILLNSHPGTKYGIPFPVFARAAYGTAGSNVPALMRALVACGWFGIQAWIGGEALHTFFRTVVPGWDTSARRRYRRACRDGMGVVSALLGAERLHHLPRNGSRAEGRELGRALRARHDGHPALVGDSDRERPRPAALAARQIPDDSANSGRCSCHR